MTRHTNKGIPYPDTGDLIAGNNTNLRTHMRDLAQASDRAIANDTAQARQDANQHTTAAVSNLSQAVTARIVGAESRITGVEDASTSFDARIQAIETLGGLEPGDVSDATVASLLGQPQSQSRAVTDQAYVARGELMVTPFDHGMIADGEADDTDALRNALAEAQTNGATLALPANRTIRISAKVTVPTGVSVQSQNTTITGNFGDYLLNFSEKAHQTGALTLIQDDTSGRCLQSDLADDLTLGQISAISSVHGAGTDSFQRCGVDIRNSRRVSIDSLYIEGYDFSFQAQNVRYAHIKNLHIEVYRRAVYVADLKDSTFEDVLVQTPSPYAEGRRGVALLVESKTDRGCSNIVFTRFVGRDADGHTFRIGSQYKVEKIRFIDCMSQNSGGCGFKALGGNPESQNWDEDIQFINCVVEDAGQDDDANSAFMVQFVRNAIISNPIIRRRHKPHSTACGISLQAADNVEVIAPNIRDTQLYGFYIGNILGDCNNIGLRGGSIISTSGNGIYINASNRIFRGIAITGKPLINTAGAEAIRIVRNAGSSLPSPQILEWQSSNGSSNMISSDSDISDFNINAYAGFNSSFQARNGSWWTSPATGVIRYRKSGEWVTL